MRPTALLPRLWDFIRSYLVAGMLVATLAMAFFEVYTDGTGPMPQQPIDGLLIERTNVSLGWSKGTRKGDTKLQVSIDDPDFNQPTLDRKASGTQHTLRELQPGHIYYWRLIRDGQTSPVAWFKTSTHAAKF